MRSKPHLVVLALVAAGLIGWRACASGRGEEVGVTPDLAGVWETTAPGYGDRFLEIRTQEIVFGQGEEGEASYPLLGVVRSVGPEGRARYVLRYQIDPLADVVGELEVLVGPADLRIASQPGVSWTAER